MERELVREKIAGIIGIALIGLGVARCNPLPPYTEAYTTPFGIVYTSESAKNNPKIVAHEQEHWRQYMEEGVVFWWRYNTDPVYACQKEIEANEAAGIEPSDNHIRCLGVDLP